MKKAIIIVLLVLLLAEALLVGMCISALRAAGDATPGQKNKWPIMYREATAIQNRPTL